MKHHDLPPITELVVMALLARNTRPMVANDLLPLFGAATHTYASLSMVQATLRRCELRNYITATIESDAVRLRHPPGPSRNAYSLTPAGRFALKTVKAILNK